MKRSYRIARCGGLGLSHGIVRRSNRHHDSTCMADSCRDVVRMVDGIDRRGVGRLRVRETILDLVAPQLDADELA